jgi:predicted nucleotidyltransferase
MNRTIDLAPADRTILRDVLDTCLPAGVRVWAFGSRVTGCARRYSDLDLALEAAQKVPFDVLSQLAEALSESDLTIKVDLVDLKAIDPSFRRLIAADMVPLPVHAESG